MRKAASKENIDSVKKYLKIINSLALRGIVDRCLNIMKQDCYNQTTMALFQEARYI